jgi:flagellar biosynthetic protein FlhB
MPDQGQRTEQPTKRRLEKARKEGRFAISREFVSAVQFLVFAWLLTSGFEGLVERERAFARSTLIEAFHVKLTEQTIVRAYHDVLFGLLLPILELGGGLAGMLLAAQLGSTQLGVALQKLAPDLSRLNPGEKLRNLPKQGMASLTQTLLLLPVFAFVVYRLAADNIAAYSSLPLMSTDAALKLVGATYKSLFWKAGFVLFLLGCLDFYRQQERHGKTLRMTKQEIREEVKENEGNPLIKMRIRRIQRDLARRSMMKEVPKATAVIVNPTHYSVAIRYDMESMAAPRVVAKGKNYLARRIREIALENLVPIVENQPLAQALYKSAEVGQEIPPHLYRAVAEILAYIYKLMRQRRP